LLAINQYLNNRTTHFKIANEILPHQYGIEYGVFLGAITEYQRLYNTVILTWMIFISVFDKFGKLLSPRFDSPQVDITLMAEIYWDTMGLFLIGTASQERRIRPPP